MAVEPTPQVPKNQLIQKKSVPVVFPLYQKVGESVGYEKTFVENVWDDDRKWNNENVWGV